MYRILHLVVVKTVRVPVPRQHLEIEVVTANVLIVGKTQLVFAWYAHLIARGILVITYNFESG